MKKDYKKRISTIALIGIFGLQALVGCVSIPRRLEDNDYRIKRTSRNNAREYKIFPRRACKLTKQIDIFGGRLVINNEAIDYLGIQKHF